MGNRHTTPYPEYRDKVIDALIPSTIAIFLLRGVGQTVMPMQTPKVSKEDVLRIVRRDFKSDEFDSVMAMLQEYGVLEWQRETDRVRLACLKLADGNIAKLRQAVNAAVGDYRDVLLPAEYPSYGRKVHGKRWHDCSELEKQNVIDKDWQRYHSWLGR